MSFSPCSCFKRDFLSSLKFCPAISNWCHVCLIISDPDFKLHVGGLLNPIPGKPFHLSLPHSIPPEEPSVLWGRQPAIFYQHSPLLHPSCWLSFLVCVSVSLIFTPQSTIPLHHFIFNLHLHSIVPQPFSSRDIPAACLTFSLLSLHRWFQIVSSRSAAQMGLSAPARWKRRKKWNPVKLWTASGISMRLYIPRWPSWVPLCHSAHPKPWPPWVPALIRPQGIARPPTARLWWGDCWRRA